MSNSPKKILFRADSSSTIGTGHIMRDLVLAKQFADAKVIFATQELEGNINHKIQEHNYPIEKLTSNDMKELNKVIRKYDIDMIVIDHYDIDYNFEKQLKTQNPQLKIFSLDDTYEKHFCDILLNHNVYAKPEEYDGLVPPHCELRCGAKYTLLRDEFILEKQKGRQNRNDPNHLNVFIAMGGADHTNLNVKILKVLEAFPSIHAHVVTTTANRFLRELQAYVSDKENITLYINTNQIAKLMNEADFAIVTPSVTINEIFYLEVPFIAIKTVENQRYMYEYLKENNFYILDRFNDKLLLQNIEELLLLRHLELVNFTELTLKEKKMILEWRNHPDIRKWMFTQEPIRLQAHLSYIDSLQNKEDRIYFLAKKDSEPIGVIDFTKINPNMKTAELGLYANPDKRGVGTYLMRSIIHYAFYSLQINTLRAKVFEDNEAALRLYKRYGFQTVSVKKSHNKNVLHMELKK